MSAKVFTGAFFGVLLGVISAVLILAAVMVYLFYKFGVPLLEDIENRLSSS